MGAVVCNVVEKPSAVLSHFGNAAAPLVTKEHLYTCINP